MQRREFRILLATLKFTDIVLSHANEIREILLGQADSAPCKAYIRSEKRLKRLQFHAPTFVAGARLEYVSKDIFRSKGEACPNDLMSWSG